MHYTGTVWRPPYEAGSLLLEVAAGCTWRRCKFCTLYDELPFSFRLTTPEVVEADLMEAQMRACDPLAKLSARLQGLPEPGGVRRVFLVGGNPFALEFARLRAIAEQIRVYLPACETVGCFARVTDVAGKTDRELAGLARMGYTGITIGAETGYGPALRFMDKGYGPEAIAEQAARLDRAGIGYCFTYLAGLPGAGRGVRGAEATAKIFNRTRPWLIGVSMLTVFPESRLYREMQAGNWAEEGELEKLEELRTLAARLEVPVRFATLGASNAVFVEGRLPEDRETMLETLARACNPANEAALRRYRAELPHL